MCIGINGLVKKMTLHHIVNQRLYESSVIIIYFFMLGSPKEDAVMKAKGGSSSQQLGAIRLKPSEECDKGKKGIVAFNMPVRACTQRDSKMKKKMGKYMIAHINGEPFI